MAISRWTSLVAVTGLATVWAGALTLLGVHALVAGPGVLPLSRDAVVALGIAALAGGQFVFMALVADRWFQHADWRLVLTSESAVVLAFGAGLAMSVVAVLAGGTV